MKNSISIPTKTTNTNFVMALYAKHPFFLFLLALVFSINQIQARESKFFSKMTRSTPTNNVKHSNAPSPAPTPTPALAPEAPMSQNGYGLYGQGSTDHLPTTKTMTPFTANEENEIIPQELATESYKEAAYNTNEYKSNNGYQSNYNNNGYETEQQGYKRNYDNNGYETEQHGYKNNNGYESELQGYKGNYNKNGYETTEKQGYKGNYNNIAYETEQQGYKNNNGYETEQQGYKRNYNNNGYETTEKEGYKGNYNNIGYETEQQGYDNNGYKTEQQGVSETKFMENGRYFDDVNKNENNGYESGRGIRASPYEFDTMEEYYKSIGEYEP